MNTNRGYSLTELITVIAIIGILATVILASLQTAREKGRAAKAESELLNVRDAIAAMLVDTRKYPNGCPSIPEDSEVNLDSPVAGLVSQPPLGPISATCEWTARDRYLWNGPYMAVPSSDPWGHPYEFDPDYFEGMDCPTSPNHDVSRNFTGPNFPAVVSDGPTEDPAGILIYDCDDVFIRLY